MVEIKIVGSTMVLRVEGADRLWAFKSHLEIPLKHITNARPDAEAARHWYGGLKLLGTDNPGAFKAGTFYENEQRVFWDVRHPEQAIVIALLDERYKELIVEVEDPIATAKMINDAVGR